MRQVLDTPVYEIGTGGVIFHVNGAGIGVFYIYINSAVAGPFAEEQRLAIYSFAYLFGASVCV